MKALWIAGLLSGVGLATPAIATAPAAPDHVERIEHRGGTVEARYQVMTQTVQRQIGAPGPGGRMASLRCVWSVDLTVRREARLPSGALASRQLERPRVLTGTRAGWCKGRNPRSPEKWRGVPTSCAPKCSPPRGKIGRR
jgi:hypothetical protein